MDRLPIDAVVPDIVAALRARPSVVITAPTGAGKTTRVPPAILDAGLAGAGQVVMLEPRRVAARAAARRMAAERGGRLGDEVGFQVRFERQCGPRTRILVVTEGLLVRMLQDDPFLENVGAVLFDEFHERSLDTDLALGMVRQVQQSVRPDLRIAVMSATLDAQAVAAYLGDAPIVAAQGRLHAVDITYEPRGPREPWPEAAARAAQALLDRTPGDLLVFLPGLREIRQTAGHLDDVARARDLLVVPLHGDLPAAEQDAALTRQPRRKIVLATNVAETSVTVEGVTGVVDTGLARVLSFDPKTGLDRLQLVPIARASADQRAGRAGRTQPGVCVRLWSESSQRTRAEQAEPEIRRVDLAGPVLQLLSWGERGVAEFPWFEPPPPAHVESALELLRRLGAVGDGEGGVTSLGRMLASLPVHPRLGCLLLEGLRWGHLDKAALAAALLSERDPFSRTQGPPPAARQETASDVLDRIEALEEFERAGRLTFPLGTLNRGAAKFVLQAGTQFQRLAKRSPMGAAEQPLAADEAILRSLLAAFPDRLARRREPGSRKGLMVGGRGVKLAPGSGVVQSELFLCVDVDAGQSEALVRQASAVRREWLPADKVTAATVVVFDETTEKVSARKRILYEDLVLEESPAALPEGEQVAAVLADAARRHWERVAPPEDSPMGQYLTRLRCLRAWLPELKLPAFDDADVQGLLSEVCAGRRSFAELRQAPWLYAFQNRLTPPQRQAVEREAPERLLVPGGSRLALRYEMGKPPVLALRIQQAFGWRETPRVAGGRVPVLLHLLAPSNRPQQVTDDLASFWTNIYPRIRKELRARYPKHAWPEDPTVALPRRPTVS